MGYSFFPVSSCCPKIQPMEFSNTVRYITNDLSSTGGSRIGGLRKCLLTIICPYATLVFLQKLEDWFTCCSHMRNEPRNVIQTSKETSDLLFSSWCRHLLNCPNLIRINLNPFLTDN